MEPTEPTGKLNVLPSAIKLIWLLPASTTMLLLRSVWLKLLLKTVPVAPRVTSPFKRIPPKVGIEALVMSWIVLTVPPETKKLVALN